ESGFNVNRSQIQLNAPIKLIGVHKVPVALHPEIEVPIIVYVARNADEAGRLARGEDVTVRREQVEEEEGAQEAAAAAAAFFERAEAVESNAGEASPSEQGQGSGSEKPS